MRYPHAFVLLLSLSALVACVPQEDPAIYNASLAVAQGASAADGMARAVFAGGCFWSMEHAFEGTPGVVDVVSGYAGGTGPGPTYEEVSSGTTDYRESIEVTYDPAKITYRQLLDIYWRQIDPSDAGGSFVDRGPQYTSAIFYGSDAQRRLAEQSAGLVAQRLGVRVATKILPFTTFYPAEAYHQDFAARNPVRYGIYREGSGRDEYFARAWYPDNSSLWAQENASAEIAQDASAAPVAVAQPFAKPSDAQLRATLTPLQYEVTQENGTEAPFDNAYWDNHAEGIYVDVVSGEPLFSSTDKFESGTGWPSFTRPLEPGNVVEVADRSLFEERTEVRSKGADSHLGHLFDDGPPPTGMRYCIDSAALRFVPKEDLAKEGYGKYAALFP